MDKFDRKLGIWNPDNEASAAQLKYIRKIEDKLERSIFTGRTIRDAHIFIKQYKSSYKK